MAERGESHQQRRREGSNIVQIQDNAGGTIRLGKLLGLQGMSYTSKLKNAEDDDEEGQPKEERTFSKFLFNNAVSSFLAVKHFNERRGDILPNLPHLLAGCDFHIGYEYRDGQQQSREATIQLMEAIDMAYYYHSHHQNPTSNDMERVGSTSSMGTDVGQRPPNSTATITSATAATTENRHHYYEYLEPFAILGAYWSRVSQTLVTVAGGFEIPYVTGGSTSTTLDGLPYFARTIPTNNADARAMMRYYRYNLNASHVALLHLKDAWGNSYFHKAQKYARQFDVTVKSFGYFPNKDSIRKTIEELRNSQYRYVFAIMWPWEDVVPIAYEYGVIGNPNYFWMAADLKEWVGDDFAVKDKNLALALDGAGTINLHSEEHVPFNNAMKEFLFNESLQQEFFSIQADLSIFLDDNNNFTWPAYDPHPIANTVFDAVIALGLTACNSSHLPDPLFTGEEFQEALLHSTFQGVSGLVEFDKKTGTRVAKDVQFSIEYISLLRDDDDDYDAYDAYDEDDFNRSLQPTEYRFQSNLVAVVQGDNITNTVHPFVFHGNTTALPEALPPVHHDYNLVPAWAQIVGCCAGGFLAILSLVCFFWTLLKSKTTQVLMASQPFFLCLLCVGTFFTSMFVPLSSFPGGYPIHTTGPLQSSHGNTDKATTIRRLDIACMSAVWMHNIGVSITISALACKLYRVDRIVALGGGLQRGAVKVTDVMAPLYITLTTYVATTLCLTLVDPLRYERVILEDYDVFGRPTSSYGTCSPSSMMKGGIIAGVAVLMNLVFTAILAYQAYKARNFPDDVSDVKSLTWAILVMVESLLVGFPYLMLVEEKPTARFLMVSFIVSGTFSAVLLLLFVPKYQMRSRRFNHSTLAPAIARSRTNSTNLTSRRQLTDCSSGRNLRRQSSGSNLRRQLTDSSSGRIRHSALSFRRINENSSTFR